MTSSETPWLEGSWRVIWVIVDDCHVHPLPGVPGVVHTPAMDPYVSMVRGQCAMLRHATLHCASEPQQSDNWIQLNFEVHVGGNLGIIQILTNTHKQHQITFKYPNIWWLILVSNHLIAGVPNLDTNQWMQSAAASPTYGQLPLVRGHVQPQFPRQLFFSLRKYILIGPWCYIYIM